MLGDAGGTGVSVRRTCDAIDTEVECEVASATPVDGADLEAGDWYLVVESIDDPPRSLRVTVE